MACCHVSHSPALITDTLLSLLQQEILNFSRGEFLRDGNEILDSQQSDGVLIVSLQPPINLQAFGDDMLLGILFKEGLQCLSAWKLDPVNDC